MVWFAIGAILLALAAAFGARQALYEPWARFAGYLILALGIFWEFGGKAFQGSETSLMGFFAATAVALALAALKPQFTWWAGATAALLLALGFDVLRPDPYSYVPAAILAFLVLAVAIRAYLTLAKGLEKKTPRKDFALLAGYVFLVALLLYSALFKMMDRGWALPWAYTASAGVLLYATAQLWLGWKILFKKQLTTDWLRLAASDAGMLLMTVSAFFVYREFL